MLVIFGGVWYNNGIMNRRKIKVSVRAKVNLSLNILGVCGGMHALDSVMASVDLTDAITVCERLDSRVNVEFDAPFNVGKINSVTRAIDVLRAQFGDFGIDVFIKKNLPLSGGLGGSSADAAAVIVAIDKIFDLRLTSLQRQVAASSVGSDVTYMLEGGFKRVLGGGEIVKKIETKQEFFMVITKPDLGVDTGICYKKFDELNPGKKLELCDSNLLINALERGDKTEAQGMFSNAMQAGACSILPVINDVIGMVESMGAEKVIMSGSGSCVAGFFDDLAKAKIAAEQLKSSGLWAIATKTMPCGIIIE